jgi:hypothetical protein
MSTRSARERGYMRAVRVTGLAIVLLGTGSALTLAASSAAPSAAEGAVTSLTLASPIWTVGPIADGANPIAMSSPNVANLAGGPAVVVGDEAGNVYAYGLATGAKVWTYNTGAPINSSPSEAATTAGSGADTTFVGTGDAGHPTGGGYQAISPSGTDKWFTQETNPSTDATAHNGVQASLAVGDLQGSTDVVAGSLGENEDALNATNGAVLNGFPWYEADSNFTTPALADLYGNGQTEIIEGGDSSAGVSYGTWYTNGGHLRILSADGNAGQPEPNDGLICQHNTNESVESSPAVGKFLGGANPVGIVFGTGATFGQSDTNRLIAVDSHCNLEWSTTLAGSTKSSPALADVLGNGQLQVVEGVDNGLTGSVYAVNGATGAPIWQALVPRVIGSVVTVDLGSGYQDVLAPTVNGVYVLDGKTGLVLDALQVYTGFQNSPLITDDPNGTIGITLAGYQSGGSFIYHYELAASNGAVANEAGAWPQFHHDAQLTGDTGTSLGACVAPSAAANGYYVGAADGDVSSFGNVPYCGEPGRLNQPIVGLTATNNAGGYWLVARDGGIFNYGNAVFYGSTGAIRLNQPIVGMAATPDDKGYWLVASDGGIFSFGDAKFFGSTGAVHLNKPVVGMAASPSGGGYWLVASDGGIFTFGDAHFYGSTGAIRLNRPVVGMATNPSGRGYWLVAADGGIFNYGNASYYGSTGAIHLNQPIVGMATTKAARGYRFVAADGGVFNFSATPFGSLGSTGSSSPVVGIAGF